MRPVQLTLLALAMLSPTLAYAADAKIALVIGNSDYPTAALLNPANDAKMIAETLTALGFEVVVRRNADQIVMKRSIQDFGARLEKAGPSAVGLFYYAGHGVQLNGRNYLIPTTAHIDREADVEIEAVSADWVIEEMRYARNALNIVILDACRNNPFSRGMRSADRGLATMEAPAGILIAYSTAPGSVAADGSGRNSPYTQALAQAMREVRAPVEQVFKRVRVSVMGTTAGKQVPWEASSLTGDFYFAGPTPPAPAVTAPPPVLATATPAPIPSSRPAPAGPMMSGASAAPLLRSLGIASEVGTNGSYPQASIRQLIEHSPRRVTLGSTPEQINSALVLCQQYASDCQSSWYADEGLRNVTLSPFQLDVAPVSVRAFRQFAEGSHFKTQAETAGFAYAVVNGSLQPVSGGSWRNAVKQRPLVDEAPVVGVSFHDAAAYCRSKGARLPSEDEWEYIARGPERHAFAWGDKATFATRSPTNPPLVTDGPVEGIGAAYRGMTGTVWQWVDTTVGGRKVLKGGSWLETNPANKRAAARRYELAERADEDSGFRCARSVPVWPDAEHWFSTAKP
jgi:uncharacterized caspase-like protein/formylglycine-generating enzyme required for sulfatase activity